MGGVNIRSHDHNGKLTTHITMCEHSVAEYKLVGYA